MSPESTRTRRYRTNTELASLPIGLHPSATGVCCRVREER